MNRLTTFIKNNQAEDKHDVEADTSTAGLGDILQEIANQADSVRRSFESSSSKHAFSAATVAAAQRLASINEKRKLENPSRSSPSTVWHKTRPFHSPIASFTRTEKRKEETVHNKSVHKKQKNHPRTSDGITLNPPPNEILITYNDVVCGRGKMTSNLVGNQRFRVWINLNRQAFAKAPCDEDRRKIAHSIVNTIHGSVPSGRFLSLDVHSAMWYDVGYARALNMTMEVLKDETRNIQVVSVCPRTMVNKTNQSVQRILASRAA